ncbi:MAG: tetratricopeptide repeat protein, partial [Myxococcota bacterium]
DRKDYSELVDFPVEIVGRDGVVRRYTFEDSIRLYQRRITFAPIRYRDNDLVRAEVNHCRSRIDQLRRSYFHRYGWGTPDGQTSVEETFGDLAGELAAFLCRVLNSEGRPEIQFDSIEAENDGVSTWYVTHDPNNSGMILYFHRFEGVRADQIRERFFSSLKAFERMGRSMGDAERLIAFHHTVDCGFVLTGRGADHSSIVRVKEDSRPVDLAPTPWDELLEIIRKGDYEAGLRRCKELVAEQPYHRNAYVAGSMLGAFLGEHLDGEDLALVGTRYFPEDGSLHYYLGLCRSRQGRGDEAETALRRALELSPDLVSARTVLVVHYVQARRYRDALDVLTARREVDPDDRRADADLAHLEHWIRWRGWAWVLGLCLGVIGVGATWQIGLAGLVVVLLGAFVAGLGWFAFQRQLDAIVARQRFEEISQGLRRLTRNTRADPLVS